MSYSKIIDNLYLGNQYSTSIIKNIDTIVSIGCNSKAININNYKILDRGNLIVYARPKSRAYHLQVSPPSLDVRGMDMISFQSWSGRVCGYAGDELIVPDSLFQGRFSITSVTSKREFSFD